MTVYLYEIYFKDLNRTKVVHRRSCESDVDAIQLLLDLETYELSDNFDRPYFYHYNCEFVLRKLSDDYQVYNFVCSYYKDKEENKVLLCNTNNTLRQVSLHKKAIVSSKKISLKSKE